MKITITVTPLNLFFSKSDIYDYKFLKNDMNKDLTGTLMTFHIKIIKNGT